jgi:hypothetical protein
MARRVFVGANASAMLPAALTAAMLVAAPFAGTTTRPLALEHQAVSPHRPLVESHRPLVECDEPSHLRAPKRDGSSHSTRGRSRAGSGEAVLLDRLLWSVGLHLTAPCEFDERREGHRLGVDMEKPA